MDANGTVVDMEEDAIDKLSNVLQSEHDNADKHFSLSVNLPMNISKHIHNISSSTSSSIQHKFTMTFMNPCKKKKVDVASNFSLSSPSYSIPTTSSTSSSSIKGKSFLATSSPSV